MTPGSKTHSAQKAATERTELCPSRHSTFKAPKAPIDLGQLSGPLTNGQDCPINEPITGNEDPYDSDGHPVPKVATERDEVPPVGKQ
jgi:hypothetical protein